MSTHSTGIRLSEVKVWYQHERYIQHSRITHWCDKIIISQGTWHINSPTNLVSNYSDLEREACLCFFGWISMRYTTKHAICPQHSQNSFGEWESSDEKSCVSTKLTNCYEAYCMWLTGMPFFIRTVGERVVDKWCIRSGWFSNNSGACCRIVCSRSSA